MPFGRDVDDAGTRRAQYPALANIEVQQGGAQDAGQKQVKEVKGEVKGARFCKG
jgi:hypothetical protein